LDRKIAVLFSQNPAVPSIGSIIQTRSFFIRTSASSASSSERIGIVGKFGSEAFDNDPACGPVRDRDGFVIRIDAELLLCNYFA
jgi:hypothetical protein